MALPINSNGWAYADMAPGDVLDYVFDVAPNTNGRTGAATDWLASGETISARTVTVTDNITLDSSSITDTSTSVTVWLSGMTAEEVAYVDCQVTTSAGRKRTRRLQITGRVS